MPQDNAVAAAPAAGVRATAPPDRRWWALVVIMLAQLMVVLDATVVNVALPHAQAALDISNADRQWIVTAYTITFGGLLLLGGRVADYFGRKRTFMIGLIGFAGASALGGFAVNEGMLVRCPRAAGRVRCAARTGRAVPAHGHVHRDQGAREGVRRVRRDLRWRRRDRPASPAVC